MAYTAEFIKNVSIAGHGGTGKTTLFERLLFAGGAIPKAEIVESGKTVSDSTPEEIDRKISIHSVLAHVERGGKKINFFDTPGSPDFTGDVILSFRASEFALLTVDAHTGVQIETVKLWRNLDTRKKPRGVFITRMDNERADFNKTLADITEKFKVTPVAITLPMGSGSDYKGVVDVLNGKAYLAGGEDIEKESPIPDEYKDAFDAARERLIEAAAEGDDSLMEQ
ncbi:MAG: GTP-binding protein, partial [Treponema sp.]|nr:GTP-binding protein [Treponema sp.]